MKDELVRLAITEGVGLITAIAGGLATFALGIGVWLVRSTYTTVRRMEIEQTVLMRDMRKVMAAFKRIVELERENIKHSMTLEKFNLDLKRNWDALREVAKDVKTGH